MRRSVTAGLAGLLLLGAPLARAELVDRIAAVVNTEVSTLRESEVRTKPNTITLRCGSQRQVPPAHGRRTPRA